MKSCINKWSKWFNYLHGIVVCEFVAEAPLCQAFPSRLIIEEALKVPSTPNPRVIQNTSLFIDFALFSIQLTFFNKNNSEQLKNNFAEDEHKVKVTNQ